MGTYADLEIERQIKAEGNRIMREHIGTDALHQAKRRLNCTARQYQRGAGVQPEPRADLAPLRAFAEEAGLTVHTPGEHHVQLRQDGRVFAEWWPGRKGTTMMDGRRGPPCRSAKDVVAWLRSV